MPETKLFAYSSAISVKPGEPVAIMVSAEGTTTAEAQLVRLIHGDVHPDGPGFIEEDVASPINGTVTVRRQYTQLGSYAIVDDPEGTLGGEQSFTIAAWVQPTLVGHGRQSILSTFDIEAMRGWALGINHGGHLEFWVGDGTSSDEVYSEVPLVDGVWYRVSASYDHRRAKVRLEQRAALNAANSRLSSVTPFDYDSTVIERLNRKIASSHRPLLWAGSWDQNPHRGDHVRWLFNGKIEHPTVWRGAHRTLHDHAPPADIVLADWNTTDGLSRHGIDDRITDSGPHGLHAHGVNKPVRGMTGHAWDGTTDCYGARPCYYGGVYFADSALIDCKWEPTIKFKAPDAVSGCYAVRLRSDDAEEYAPFFLRAPSPTAPVALQIPTASYLAYANEHIAFDVPVAQSITAHPPVFSDRDVEMYRKTEFGLSTYDHHSDHINGVCFSGWRRPIFNMRPKHRTAAIDLPWQFPADLSIVAWLEQQPLPYEIITDHDVQTEGVDLLSSYNVVVTGTHPEYYSAEMLTATEVFMERGGRLMYMGGNGLYWVTSFADDDAAIEVRRLEAGTRAWQALPGEYYHSTDGVRGGIWSYRGRGPHKVTGVGFNSEGMDESAPYYRDQRSYGEDVAWIFDGVDNTVFGSSGLAHGGAAGVEIDRYDPNLGSPRSTRLLASSRGHTDGYSHVIEEILTNTSGQFGDSSPLIRADLTYTTTPAGGGCFSTGSIAWGQALPVTGFDNDISRITANVLQRFATDAPLTHLDEDLGDQQQDIINGWTDIQGKRIMSLVDQQLGDEFAAAPFGPYSDELLAVLNFFRRTADTLAIAEVEPLVRYDVVDAGATLSSYTSPEAAAQDIFERRIAALEAQQ